MNRPSFGYILVMSVPFVAAISSLSGLQIYGLEYKGFLWSATLAIGLFLTANHLAHYKEVIPFPIWIWLPWFFYGWLSLLWGGIQGRYSIQNPCQIMTPFVVGILASLYVRNEHQLSRLLKAFKLCLPFYCIVFVFFWYGPGADIQKFGTGYGPRVNGLTLVFVGAIFLSGLRENTLHSILGWIACLTIVTLSGSRMAAMVLLLHWCFYPLYKSSRSRFISFALIVALSIGLFYTPLFQKRFFVSGSGHLSQVVKGDFSGSGRFEYWPVLWNQATENIVLGGGAGGIAAVQKELDLPENFDMASNDYLRILLDYGVIGLLLFLVAVILQLYKVRKIIRSHPSKGGKAFVVAYLGLLALLVTTITENTMTYVVYYMNPLFAVLGAAYGIEARRKPINEGTANAKAGLKIKAHQ